MTPDKEIHQFPIRVLLFPLIWITSNGNCQTWDGCEGHRIVDNCVTSETDGQWRCFCLQDKMPSTAWQGARSDCRSTYQYHQGDLATDDSSNTHEILQRLFVGALSGEAWIGARTRPRYWNWMATQENNYAQPISYQGCYERSGVDAGSHMISGGNLRSKCRTICANNNYNYFALEKEEIFWRTYYYCSCGHHFNSATVHYSCVKCDTAGDDHGWCGTKSSSSKGIYFIHAVGLFNKWAADEAHGINTFLCLLYDTSIKEWISDPCSCHYENGLCVRDGPDCIRPEILGPSSGKCFRVQQGVDVTQREASEACHSQGMSLMSASNYSIHKDAMDIMTQWGKGDIYFWTSGTTLRWVWITEEEVGVNGQYVGWADKQEEFAFENMCMTLNSSGIWSSQSCSGDNAYICETVVGDYEIIPRQTSTLSAAITESSSPTVQETMTSTRVTTATTHETRVSTRQTTASTQETGTTGPQVSGVPPGGPGSDSGRQVALTAGATVAGIIFLLVLLAITLFFIRRKQKVQKATSKQPNAFVHNNFPLNNLQSNGAVSSNVATKGAYENVTFQKEPEYYNVPAASMKDKRNSRSNMSRNEQREKQTESRTNESASNADLADGLKRDNVEMMENDLYYSSCLPESSTNTADNTQGTAKSHNAKLSPVYSSHDTTKEGKSSKESGHQYYNFTKSPTNNGNTGVCMADMVDNDIYVPSEESGPVTESVPNMIDNDIYETAEDVNELGKGKTHRSKPQIPYPKPQEMQHSHLQGTTGHYELASPVIQIGNQGQEAKVAEHGVGNDLYANVNKPKPKQHTTQEK